MANLYTSPSINRLQGIEIARGIAASMVVFYHAARHIKNNIGYLPFNGITQFGHAGVDFFFVLSGFIIFFIHVKDIGRPMQIGHYVKRRIIRIYPIYWVVTIITLLLSILFSKNSFSFSLENILTSVFLFPSHSDTIVNVAWTLKYEIMFYVLFAILIINKKIGTYIFLVWFFSIVAAAFTNYFINYKNPFFENLTSIYSIQFFFGMFAGMTAKIIKPKNGKFFFSLGAFLFLMFGIGENANLFNGYEPPARVYYGLSSVLLIIGLANIKLKKGGAYKFLLQIGSASYSIYLSHFIFIGIIYKIMKWTHIYEKSPIILTFSLFVIAAIAGGILLSKIIEYPVIQWLNKVVLKRQTV